MDCQNNDEKMCELQAEKATLPKTFKYVYYTGLIVILFIGLSLLFQGFDIGYSENKLLVIGFLIIFTFLALWKIFLDLIVVLRKVDRVSKESKSKAQ